jgi:hypothetical protein
VLRFFDFTMLASASAGATYASKVTLRILRLLLARPLWWLAAHLLAVPDASARYVEFRNKALAKWEDFLLSR